MGLKQRLAVLYLNTSERVRPPRHSVMIARLLDDLGVECVIDIGANVGQFGKRLRQTGFTRQIVSCEPVGDAFANLAAAAAADARWTVEQVAVGAEPGTLTMHVSGNSVSSSVLPMADRHLELSLESAYTRDEEVTVTTVEALVKAHGLDPSRTMLKADVQGFEWAVLDGAGALLDEFAMILVETSLIELYEGQPLMPEMLARLTAAGHTLWSLIPGWIDRVNGRLWWGDGLFVRSDLAERIHSRARGPVGRSGA